MSPKFEAWKMRVKDLPAAEAEFEKSLFVTIVSVLLARKAGELFILKADRSALSIKRRIGHMAALSESWGFDFIVLGRIRSSARMIVYNRRKVQEVLSQVPGWALDAMNYGHDIGPTEFLKEVGRRWQDKGEIPHEIGLALGYPIKDVLGFMGLSSLSCSGGCGWRIYGNRGLSVRLSCLFQSAKKQARAFLSQ